MRKKDWLVLALGFRKRPQQANTRVRPTVRKLHNASGLNE
jgi:hypothetical protein